jgi:hypothetical protein
VRLVKSVIKKFSLVILLVSTIASALAASRDGGVVGNAMPIMRPIIPNTPFEYKCTLTWIADGPRISMVDGKYQSPPMSRAEFIFNNERVSINFAELEWTHGYANNLDPFNAMTNAGTGKGEALKSDVTPYNVTMYFNYIRNREGSEAYDVQLELAYGIRKSESSHSTVDAGCTVPMSTKQIKIQGRTYSNGVGESQDFFVYGLSCNRTI